MDAANQAYYVAGGTFATFDTSTRNANATLEVGLLQNKMTQQVAIQAAKDTLRATGDIDIV